MKKLCAMTIQAMVIMLVSVQTAMAHISFDASPAIQGKTFTVGMNIGHGCEDEFSNHFDTIKIEVEIPAALTAVKPADMPYFTATVETDATPAKNVTKIIWTKDVASRPTDMAFYHPTFRAKLPNTPFVSLELKTTQTCMKDGAEMTLVWEGADVPRLNILPTRFNGWNKYTAQSTMDEATIKAFFADAEIVWQGAAAYSSNPAVNAAIAAKLTTIPMGAEYWVKY